VNLKKPNIKAAEHYYENVGDDDDDDEDNITTATTTNTTASKKTVTFSIYTPPSKNEEIDTFFVGEYKFTFDEKICTASVWKDNKLVIRLNEDFIHCLYRLYEVISLKLELLQKYHFYAVYLSSRYINHFIKIKEKEPTEDDVSNLNLSNIPKIEYLKVDYSNLDVHVCRILHAEIRIWALNQIFKTVKTIKSLYSRSWIQSNHMYL